MEESEELRTRIQPTVFPRRRHAGRLHGMVELIDAGRDTFDEATAGVRQPHAPRVALEQEDAKVFHQRFHASADAR